jgi:uncharacterized protein (TIGR00299 family) protein
MSKVLLIDPRLAGCSGDMIISALKDLLGDEETLIELSQTINDTFATEFDIQFSKVLKQGMQASQLKIEIKKDIDFNQAEKITQAFKQILSKIKLSQKATELANDMINTLLSAEASVHGKDREELHLHETASLDTIFDILGVVKLLDKHNLINVPIYGLPVNTGSGFITFSHGKVTVPPPAVLEILKKKEYPFFSDEIDGELLTPTGITILSNLVTRVIRQFPPITIQKVGIGAGMKELPKRANTVRFLLAETIEDSSKFYLSMLETHLDDVTGELLGAMIPLLLEKGALDVSYYPLIMKKNRPAWCLRVICDENKAAELAEFMMRELGTLGVRENRFARYEMDRRVSKKKFFIRDNKVECRYKERIVNEEVVGVKPEYDDLIKISKITDIPLIELERKLIELYYLEDEHCE